MKEFCGFCGEIAYDTKNGGIHSDICWHNDEPISEEYRQLLHNCLDEWLNNSNGTGAFWLGDAQYFAEFGGE